MKTLSWISLLLALAIGIILFACSSDDPAPGASSDSGDPSYSSDSNDDSSDSGNSGEKPSSSANKPSSSSNSPGNSSANTAASSSSRAAASSSSSKASSSSVAASPCVQPMNGVPPNGVTSCIIVGNKCYTCNPERGNECTQGWIWQGGNVTDTHWYKEVSCGGSIGGTSSNSSGGTSSNSSGGTSSNSGGGGTPSYTPTAPGTETSKLTHYWDSCKPSCSWSGKGGLQSNSCDINGKNIGHNDSDKSSCDGGNAFMCMNNAPRKIGNVSFGYVAAAVGNCGDCYQFDFPNGEVMVVMANNHGNIHEGAKFDLMVPGGGVGDFNALTRQIQQLGGPSNPDMGEKYGGFRGACGWEYSAAAANCVKQKCESVFANIPELKAGCLWYVNTLGTDEASWNNPTVRYKKVTCPKELTERY